MLPDCKNPRGEGKITRNRKAHMEKEEIKEATIAARNGLSMEVEVVVTKTMIIKIMATEAFI